MDQTEEIDRLCDKILSHKCDLIQGSTIDMYSIVMVTTERNLTDDNCPRVAKTAMYRFTRINLKTNEIKVDVKIIPQMIGTIEKYLVPDP